MPFTPVESSVGGLLIGISTAAHLLLNGEISGMSGIAARTMCSLTMRQDLLCRFEGMKSVVYIVGLLVGGFVVSSFIAPQQFVVIKQWNILQLIMFGIGGLLVGIGTQLGNGCTSGHMICGIARLSKRSFVAVISFCSVAFVLVKVFGIIDFVVYMLDLQYDEFGALITFATIDEMIGLGLIVLTVIAIYGAVILVDFDGKRGNIYLQLFLHFFNAFVFALGLGISGMVNPLKVLGFFDIFGKYFDPSLFCVAIGAILLDLILFQKFILVQNAPIIAKSFQLPSKSDIDMRLVIGALIFGLGWGTVGVCPGPAIVNLATLAPQFIVFNIMFAVSAIIYSIYNTK